MVFPFLHCFLCQSLVLLEKILLDTPHGEGLMSNIKFTYLLYLALHGFLSDTTIYWNHNMKITQQLQCTVEVEHNTNVRFSSPVSTCSLPQHWPSLVDRKEHVA